MLNHTRLRDTKLHRQIQKGPYLCHHRCTTTLLSELPWRCVLSQSTVSLTHFLSPLTIKYHYYFVCLDLHFGGYQTSYFTNLSHNMIMPRAGPGRAAAQGETIIFSAKSQKEQKSSSMNRPMLQIKRNF